MPSVLVLVGLEGMGEAVQGCTPARLFIMADNATKIATLQAILDAGASGVSVDGESVTYDLAAIRKEIRELKQADPNFRNMRPRAASINLGGF